MNPLDPHDFTVFDIPSGTNRYGEMVMERVIVQNRMIPVMAQIVRSATKPVALTQQYIYSLRGVDKTLGESILRQLRDRIRYDLERGLRADAAKHHNTVITPISHEETADELGVLFVARAVAMPLVEVEL